MYRKDTRGKKKPEMPLGRRLEMTQIRDLSRPIDYLSVQSTPCQARRAGTFPHISLRLQFHITPNSPKLHVASEISASIRCGSLPLSPPPSSSPAIPRTQRAFARIPRIRGRGTPRTCSDADARRIGPQHTCVTLLRSATPPVRVRARYTWTLSSCGILTEICRRGRSASTTGRGTRKKKRPRSRANRRIDSRDLASASRPECRVSKQYPGRADRGAFPCTIAVYISLLRTYIMTLTVLTVPAVKAIPYVMQAKRWPSPLFTFRICFRQTIRLVTLDNK